MAHILVVDDEDDICRLIRDAFFRNGHDVDVAHNGRQALELLRQSFYDAMILDLVMPGMTGEQVLDHREEYAETAVIILTAHSSTSSAVKALRTQVSDYLEKPVELARLVEMVESYIVWHSYKDFKVNIQSQRAFYKGELIEGMTAGLFYIFSIFVKYPGRYFTHQELVTQMVKEYPDYFGSDTRAYIAKKVNAVGGIDRITATRYLRPQISRLRRKVLDPLVGREVITDQKGVGFTWGRFDLV
jgi:DNA-binding response OmpR family regulator